METQQTEKRMSFLELVAKTNKPLAAALKGKHFEDLQTFLGGYFIQAYMTNEDREAERIFVWYASLLDEDGNQDRDRYHPEFCAATAALHLSRQLSPDCLWTGASNTMTAVHAAMIQALASGAMRTENEERAHALFRVLLVNYERAWEGIRSMIVAHLKIATGKDCPVDRVLRFAATKDLPQELRRVLMNAWMRNSSDASQASIVAIASVLEGCSQAGHDAAEASVKRIAEVDRAANDLMQRIRDFMAFMPEGIWSPVSIQLECRRLLPNIELRIDVRNQEGVRDGSWNAVCEMAGHWFKRNQIPARILLIVGDAQSELKLGC